MIRAVLFGTYTAAHPANRRLALARSKKTEVQGFGLSLSLLGKGNNGHFAPFAWAS